MALDTPQGIADAILNRVNLLNVALQAAKSAGLKVELQSRQDPQPRVQVTLYQELKGV